MAESRTGRRRVSARLRASAAAEGVYFSHPGGRAIGAAEVADFGAVAVSFGSGDVSRGRYLVPLKKEIGLEASGSF